MSNESIKRRIGRMIRSDSEALTEETYEAAALEFARVASEFFERTGEVNLEVKRSKEGLFVSLTFPALRAKNFTVLH